MSRLVVWTIAIVAAIITVVVKAQAPQNIDIAGAGASFPADLYARLTSQFQRTEGRNVGTFSYNGQSSAFGLAQQNTNLTIQWGGSDVAVDPKVYNKSTLIALPAVSGAIAIAYNVPELVTTNPPLVLRISRGVLPQIFMGNITQWNDPLILQDNLEDVQRALRNVNRTIQLVVRNPGSGTTTNFVRFMGTVNNNVQPFSNWNTVLSATARAGLINARTNLAVGNIVASIPYTITYMDAQELDIANGGNSSVPPSAAAVQNRNLEYVLPTVSALRIAFENLKDTNID
ncbi:hypothetical protein HDU96_004422, partial [Phlyctochytrium bullatum]